MEVKLARPEELSQLCLETEVADGAEFILAALSQCMPNLSFSCVLTRGNWHRLGGIVDKEYRPISDNISSWAENECAGNVDDIIVKHVESGYFATRIAGKTNYFTAAYGENGEEFIQLEIEQLQEVIDRPLVDKDWYPDSMEEFIDPTDYPRLEPETVGKAYYRFRRILDIEKILTGKQIESRNQANLKRFFSDWNETQSPDENSFCYHWILALREYIDSEGECRLSAKPVPTFKETLPSLPKDGALHGTALSQEIHSYDRLLGFPFAWYFMLLSSKASNYALAQAVLNDQMGAYDYLPAKELKILRAWEVQPYSV